MYTLSKLKLKYIKSKKCINNYSLSLLWDILTMHTQELVCNVLFAIYCWKHTKIYCLWAYTFSCKGVFFAKMHLFKQLFIDNYLVQFDSQWFMKTFWNIFDSNFASFYQIDLWKAIKIWFLCWHAQSFDENKIITNSVV